MGFVSAMGVRSVAGELLHDPIWPWYARRGAVALLPAWLIFMTAVGGYVIETVLLAHGPRYAPPKEGCLFLLLAAELLSIVLLDWPAGGWGWAAPPRQQPPPRIPPPYSPYHGPVQRNPGPIPPPAPPPPPPAHSGHYGSEQDIDVNPFF
jgi:hypothetical protein